MQSGDAPDRMRRSPAICCAVAVALGLSACNRSASDLPAADDQETRLPPTLTSVFPLRTPPTAPPSATLPPPSTATSSPTATITLTPSPGPSASPTGPQLPPSDPRAGLNLSAPDYSDDFSTRFKWYEFSDPQAATNLYAEDGFKAADNVADHAVWWSGSDQVGGDVYAEVNARIGTCSGSDGYGLAVRVGGGNFDRGYALEFSCDGSYRLRKFIGNAEPVSLIDWTEASQLRSGADASNQMGLMAKGDMLYVVANGELIGETSDNDYTYGGFGLYASAVETAGVEVVFDDFALWYLQP